MYILIDVTDNTIIEYPSSIYSLKAIYPNTGFPDDASESLLNEFGLFVVQGDYPPYDSKTHKIIESTPVFTDGVWERQFSIVSLSTEEITDVKNSLISQAGAVRYEHEIAGVEWNGYLIATDRESQSKLSQERYAVSQGLRTTPKGWKCKDLSSNSTVFRSTTNDEILDLANTVYSYVSACFAREEVLIIAISDGSYTDDMLTVGWP